MGVCVHWNTITEVTHLGYTRDLALSVPLVCQGTRSTSSSGEGDRRSILAFPAAENRD